MSADKSGRSESGAKKRDGGRRPAAATDSHVANALRSAYEEAVREDVPPEFLDLLGKLT